VGVANALRLISRSFAGLLVWCCGSGCTQPMREYNSALVTCANVDSALLLFSAPEGAAPFKERAEVFVTAPNGTEPVGGVVVLADDNGQFVLRFDRDNLPAGELDLVVRVGRAEVFRRRSEFKRLSLPAAWVVVLPANR